VNDTVGIEWDSDHFETTEETYSEDTRDVFAAGVDDIRGQDGSD